MNVTLAVKRIREKSSLLRGMADKGEIKIVGAMLDVKTGSDVRRVAHVVADCPHRDCRYSVLEFFRRSQLSGCGSSSFR